MLALPDNPAVMAGMRHRVEEGAQQAGREMDFDQVMIPPNFDTRFDVLAKNIVRSL